MRFLHTADWHLGRSFHGASLLSHQASFLEWLAELADEEAVDAVLVSGDLYDRALPPAEAVQLAGEGLQRLAQKGRQVVVISGNHDSAARLSFASGLLERAGLHFRLDAATCERPIVIGDAAVYGIPYLEPDLVAASLGCERRSHEGVLRATMERVRAEHGARQGGRGCLVLAHAFVAGASPAASERELAVGGAGQVGARLFTGADYVALGHLHRPQAVHRGRYAGSPLAFSFSEVADVKSVTVGELRREPAGPAPAGQDQPRTRFRVTTRTVACPVPRRLARLRGSLQELLDDPDLAGHEDDWVEATLTDAARPLDAMARLQRRFPHAVCLQFEPQGAREAGEGSYGERLAGLSEEEVLARFVLDVRGTEAAEEELALLRDALDAGRERRVKGLAG